MAVSAAIPPPDGVTADLTHPEDVLHTLNLASVVASVILVTLFVFVRAYARLVVAPPLLREDCEHTYFETHALLLLRGQLTGSTFPQGYAFLLGYFQSSTFPPCFADDPERAAEFVVLQILVCLFGADSLAIWRFGGGYQYDIPVGHRLVQMLTRVLPIRSQYEISESENEKFLKAVYAGSLIYGPCALAVKSTILLTVTRCFEPYQRTVTAVHAFMGVMVAYYAIAFGFKADICTPLAGFWDRAVPATCLDQRGLFVADTIVAATTDAAVLLLPAVLCHSLMMPLRQKLKIVGMLGAGGVATAASFVRMAIVLQLRKTHDETVDMVRFGLLGTAEVSIGLVCSCFPAANTLVYTLMVRRPRPAAEKKQEYAVLGRLRLLSDATTRSDTVGTTLVATLTADGDVPQPSPPEKLVTRIQTRESVATTL